MSSKVKYKTGHWAHYWAASEEGTRCKTHGRWLAHAMAAAAAGGWRTVPWHRRLSLARWHDDKLGRGG